MCQKVGEHSYKSPVFMLRMFWPIIRPCIGYQAVSSYWSLWFNVNLLLMHLYNIQQSHQNLCLSVKTKKYKHSWLSRVHTSKSKYWQIFMRLSYQVLHKYNVKSDVALLAINHTDIDRADSLFGLFGPMSHNSGWGCSGTEFILWFVQLLLFPGIRISVSITQGLCLAIG